jgi:hypothetical protein
MQYIGKLTCISGILYRLLSILEVARSYLAKVVNWTTRKVGVENVVVTIVASLVGY